MSRFQRKNRHGVPAFDVNWFKIHLRVCLVVSHIKKTVDFYSVVLKQITYLVGSVVLGFPTF